jgi:hypothetical protein
MLVHEWPLNHSIGGTSISTVYVDLKQLDPSLRAANYEIESVSGPRAKYVY